MTVCLTRQFIPVIWVFEKLQVGFFHFQMFGHRLDHLLVLVLLRQGQDESGVVGAVFVHKVDIDAEEQVPEIVQVWPLTQFFSVSFLCKTIDLPGGQINDPSSGKHYSLPFLPATPSSPSRTLEGLFELTRRPSRALDSPRALLPELQRYKDTVR